MSYLVLARKWRPRRFAELVGQEHVVRALTNALDSGRLHHAFLFTGTRGVGKTTIARIFAKSLNCEQGTSAEPCGECGACRDIDAGRFMDLLEIDAASNTGVDDVREVIENAQYMPGRGRMKVYLIDEVHMLSKAAFNALLKTLEEPPGHVKFLLATTDPQKLPVTVLSRCLQFNLKRLDEEQISGQITKILEAEGIAAEPGAVRQLSRAADGSLRDGLSLLDQAIAYTGGELTDASVATMLGTVDRTRVGALLQALAAGDGAALMDEVAALAEFSPDWASVLDALGEALHRVQVRQLVPGAAADGEGVDVEALASQLRPEVVQLWYQMALHGRRDLPLAPSPRAGFEMCVLRMLAFRPAGSGDVARVPEAVQGAGQASQAVAAAAPSAPEVAPASPERASGDTQVAVENTGMPAAIEVAPPARQGVEADRPRPVSGVSSMSAPAAPSLSPGPEASAGARPAAADVAAAVGQLSGTDDWHALLDSGALKGPAKLLAEHVGFLGFEEGVVRLSLPASDEHLRTGPSVRMLGDALASALGGNPQIRFESAAEPVESVRERKERVRDERQNEAEAAFMADPDVQRLIARHGARIVPDSIRPFDGA